MNKCFKANIIKAVKGLLPPDAESLGDWEFTFKLSFGDCLLPKIISQGNVFFLGQEYWSTLVLKSLAIFSKFGTTLKGHSNSRFPFGLAISSAVKYCKPTSPPTNTIFFLTSKYWSQKQIIISLKKKKKRF